MTETLLQDFLQALRRWPRDLVGHTPEEKRIRQLSLPLARDQQNWTDGRGELAVRCRKREREHVAEPELACDRPGEPGLAGARLARHEQRLLDGEGRVDGGDQLGVCQIAAAFRALRDFGARRQRAVALVALPRR